MYNTPVLFLIFNRPDLTERVFSVIREVRPSQLFIAADGPRENRPGEDALCEQARNIVLTGIDWECEVHTLFRDGNLGCKMAVSSAISWFFEQVDEGIILEDDIYPDPSFFNFCNEMLTRYRDDHRITQISGANLMGRSATEKSYIFSKVGGIWGWATWRRAWKQYDVNITSWKDKEVQAEMRHFLGNADWFNRLKPGFDTVYARQYDTWDHQWVYAQLKMQGLAINPAVNLVENIGFREDATHTTNSNAIIETNMRTNKLEWPLRHPDKVIADQNYMAYYFNLLARPQSYAEKLFLRIKAKIKNALRKTD